MVNIYQYFNLTVHVGSNFFNIRLSKIVCACAGVENPYKLIETRYRYRGL